MKHRKVRNPLRRLSEDTQTILSDMVGERVNGDILLNIDTGIYDPLFRSVQCCLLNNLSAELNGDLFRVSNFGIETMLRKYR